jgi:thiol-disulfide isomerase/thioredoxin
MEKKEDTMMEKTTEVMEKSDTEMVKDGMVKDETTMEKGDESVMMKKEDAMIASAGSYEMYAPEKLAKASSGDVVLFFKASWCPSCRTVDADIKAHLKEIPSDLTILEVDYDKSVELKKKYGVTYQHTFVQVDAQGTLIKKWSASPSLVALVAEVK